MPRFYLGGGSAEAWDVSAKHADIHLFWGDTPARIAANIGTIRASERGHLTGSIATLTVAMSFALRSVESSSRPCANAALSILGLNALLFTAWLWLRLNDGALTHA